MKKIIYIASLSHSGSTLLDFLLSHHPNIVGLGEIYSVIINKKSNLEKTTSTCSCGQELNQCPIWSQYQPSSENYTDAYREIITKLESNKTFSAVVDSSKNIRYLNFLIDLEKNKEIELKVIFLIRDARGWAASFSDIGRKDGQLLKPPAYGLYRWLQGNKKIKKFLDDNRLSYLTIGYDELCFQTLPTLEKIIQFIGLDLKKISLDQQQLPNSHIAYGNRAKLTLNQNKQINYDTRWFNRFWLNLFFLLIPQVRRWNKKNTPLPKYKN